MSDSKEAIRTLPANVAHLWDVTDTGKRLCRNSVVDLVRAMATRTSWSAIAEAINEMKMTAWVKSTTIVYLQLCESLGIQPSSVPSAMPEAWRISHKWVRRLFVTDANERRGAICQELAAEKGGDMLALDWTKDAATRAGKPFLFNVMDQDGKVLLSQLTESTSPYEVEPAMRALKSRGVCPKVVYVDDGCCNIWPKLLAKLWPDVHVRLDGQHAI